LIDGDAYGVVGKSS